MVYGRGQHNIVKQLSPIKKKKSTLDELPSPPSRFLLHFMYCGTQKNRLPRTGQGADS